jgi:hypothetical protein
MLFFTTDGGPIAGLTVATWDPDPAAATLGQLAQSVGALRRPDAKKALQVSAFFLSEKLRQRAARDPTGSFRYTAIPSLESLRLWRAPDASIAGKHRCIGSHEDGR